MEAQGNEIRGVSMRKWIAIIAVAALLACAGIAYSATVMADPIGYVIAGLYSMDTLTGFITFGVVALAAWLLYIVAGFTGMAKE